MKHLGSVPTRVLSGLLVSPNYQIPNLSYRKGADLTTGFSIVTAHETVTRYAVMSLLHYVLAKGVPSDFPYGEVLDKSTDWRAMHNHTAASRAFTPLYEAHCLDRKRTGISAFTPIKVMLLSVKGVPKPITLSICGTYVSR